MEKKTKGHKGAIDEVSQGKSRQVKASRCEFGLSQVEAEYRRVRTVHSRREVVIVLIKIEIEEEKFK